MNSDDLGPAMALHGASDEGSRKALRSISLIANGVADKIQKEAEAMADPHDHTATMNMSTGWRIFAADLKAAAR